MTINRGYWWALVATSLAGVCFIGTRLVMRARASLLNPQAAVTPFTLKVEVMAYTHNPRGEPHRRQTIAIRSDGSRSVTETILGRVGLEAGETAWTIRFIDGRRVTMYPSLRVKSTRRLPGPAAVEQLRAQMFNPSQDCLSPDFRLDGHDTLEGQQVAIVTHTSDDLGWKVTDWRAPELACQSLKYLSYDKQPDGTFKLQTESKTVSLELGEPNPALFEEPLDYQEMKPSEPQRMLAEKYHIPVSKDLQETWDASDRAYFGALRPDTPAASAIPQGH
ncbi:MAG TPA: hypothetical protein VG028_16515 [Terriglobia bacterium]|nr:hypothetical protein [Terriglobia bacterium]